MFTLQCPTRIKIEWIRRRTSTSSSCHRTPASTIRNIIWCRTNLNWAFLRCHCIRCSIVPRKRNPITNTTTTSTDYEGSYSLCERAGTRRQSDSGLAKRPSDAEKRKNCGRKCWLSRNTDHIVERCCCFFLPITTLRIVLFLLRPFHFWLLLRFSFIADDWLDFKRLGVRGFSREYR